MTRLPIIAAVAAMLCQPAIAGSVVVSTRGLDLASADGRAILEHRISTAARQLCAVNGTVSLREQIASRQCVADAIDGTRTRLASLYEKAGAKGYAGLDTEHAGLERPALPAM
ncbi:MAG TPA: UrcA family protein [Sphingomonas sp.]|nr:UrcA family protein [Sphingomonas sp.]